MKIEIKSKHIKKEQFKNGFVKMISDFRKTKQCKEMEKNGCKKMILNFITGKMTSIYPNKKSTIEGLIKEKD